MHYLALHHWSNFQIILTTFWGVTCKKTTQKQPEMVLSAAKKTLEI